VDELAPSTISAAALIVVFTMLAGKHIVADYLLQPPWMAYGKQHSRNWLAPLAAHAACHGALTTAIVLAAAPRLWWLGIVDFLVHFAIDRTKSVVTATYRWTPADRWFWWSIGIDQSLHHLTGFFIAVTIVAGR
jgi:hypothetical protein